MQDHKTDDNRSRLLKRTGVLVVLAGLFVFLLYMHFFVGLGDVIDKIRQVDLFYYSSAFASMFLSVAFYSLTWLLLLHLLSVKCSFFKSFQYIWVGTFVDLLVPAESISGDISRVYLMSRDSGENAGKVAASVVGHRILTMVVTLSGLAISSIYFVAMYHPPALIMEFVGVVGAGTLVSVILIFYLSKRRKATERLISSMIRLLVWLSRGHWQFTRLKRQAEKVQKAFHEGIDSLSVQRSGLVLPVMVSIVAWILDLLVGVFVFRALRVPVSFSAIVIVYSFTMAVQTLPVGIPGEVGILDVIMSFLYTTLLGVPVDVGAAATVLIRVVTLWVRLLIGGLTVQWLGIKGFKPANSAS